MRENDELLFMIVHALRLKFSRERSFGYDGAKNNFKRFAETGKAPTTALYRRQIGNFHRGIARSFVRICIERCQSYSSTAGSFSCCLASDEVCDSIEGAEEKLKINQSIKELHKLQFVVPARFKFNRHHWKHNL